MARSPIPYPPSPPDVPDDYTTYSPEHASRQKGLVAGLIFFLLFYA